MLWAFITLVSFDDTHVQELGYNKWVTLCKGKLLYKVIRKLSHERHVREIALVKELLKESSRKTTLKRVFWRQPLEITLRKMALEGCP